MHRVFWNYVDQLEAAANNRQLREALEMVTAGLDLPLVAYLALPDKPKGRPKLITNYPEGWRSLYIARGYQRSDPIMIRAHHAPNPFGWGPRFAALSGLAAPDGFFDEAAAHGIRHGYTIPIHDGHCPVAALSFATDQRLPLFNRSIRRNIGPLCLIAFTFHQRAQRKAFPIGPDGKICLTWREQQILDWKMQGKSANDIAGIVKIKPRSAVWHIENAKTKIGVRTSHQAVSILAASNPKDS
jgi:LuxR family transcriptional activator of conjugal transfer of Ti plasmids